jgi:glycosyltransferase involved in cell wall biosynthesis
LKVVFFHRKQADGNFSIEALFQQVRNSLPDDIDPKMCEMLFYSRGFFRRLFCCLQAFFSQGEVNHVTGDIHFVTLFLRRNKTVLTIHDLGFMEGKSGLSYFILKWFWIVWPAKHCKVITVISEATKNELIRYVPGSASKIKVIYNPVSDLFRPLAKQFNKTRPVILQIGTKHNKNIDRLLQAVKGLPCVVYFLGKLERKQVQLLNQFSISYKEYINLSTEEVVELYRSCDVVSFVSTVEGFGLPIVEANAVGRAVVTSNISSMPEVAGGSAHLVDPFDVQSIRVGIQKILDDDAYREQLIKNGFENAKRFDIKQIADQYAGVYRKLSAQ